MLKDKNRQAETVLRSEIHRSFDSSIRNILKAENFRHGLAKYIDPLMPRSEVCSVIRCGESRTRVAADRRLRGI
jgi:hypothetical protein